MISVSIIVPVYNVKEEYLRKCLESLINQTMTGIEIILINDGSTDYSGVICDEYSELDHRVSVIHQENAGVSVARNNGIDIAKGKWVTFVDADDWIDDSMCEVIVNLAEKWDSKIMVFPPVVHKETDIFENPFFERDIEQFDPRRKDELEIRTMVQNYPEETFHTKAILTGHTFGKLILREFLIKSKIRFQKGLLLQQDGIFYLNLMEKCSNISYANKFLYHYRLYQTSSHMKSRKNTRQIYFYVQQAFYKFIEDYNKPMVFHNAYYAKCVSDISIIIKNDFFNKDNKISLHKRLKGLRTFLNEEPYQMAIRKCRKEYLTKLKQRNLFYYRYNLLLIMWIDWGIYNYRHK